MKFVVEKQQGLGEGRRDSVVADGEAMAMGGSIGDEVGSAVRGA
jgi:hypothetical protein